MFLKPWYFIKLTRPLFLLGGALLYSLGIAAALATGAAISPGRALFGQVIVTLVQLATHYCNEYYDQEADQWVGENRTLFSGGSGILSSGLLQPASVLLAAQTCAVAASVLLLLALTRWPLAGLVGTISLLAAWYYSSPPLSLKGSGWGELSASLVVALLAPLTGYAFQTGSISLNLVAYCLPLIWLHWAMLIAFSMPDRTADLRAGYRTLAVRLGLSGAARLHHVLLLLAALSFLAVSVVKWGRPLWVVTLLPLAVLQVILAARYAAGSLRRPGLLTLSSIALFALSAFLSLVAILITTYPAFQYSLK